MLGVSSSASAARHMGSVRVHQGCRYLDASDGNGPPRKSEKTPSSGGCLMTWMYEISTAQDREARPSIDHWAVIESAGGGASPVQHWGTFHNGWRFYFRFRYNHARLNVAPPGTPMEDVPQYNPEWSYADLATAFEAGKEYTVPRCLGPEVHDRNVYPGEPLAGMFLREEDLTNTFARCFEQLKDEIGMGDDMVCADCRNRKHEQCRGGTWCDC